MEFSESERKLKTTTYERAKSDKTRIFYRLFRNGKKIGVLPRGVYIAPT